MRLYDSLKQDKREFAPRDGDRVTMYFCGPTVYNYIHLGNARPYVLGMVAKRYFESQGLQVTLAVNITDIDDRIISKAIAEGKGYREIADFYAAAYTEDTSRLGLGRPDIEPYATDHIPEIIDLVQKLVDNGHAYERAGDVYFDVSSYPGYGRLSKQNVAEMRHGARITPGEDKDDPLDFALWKGAKPDEPAWDSPWGPGRPGWHIECSAMSAKYLGAGFDIHGGGRDLIFPHHENEIAQSEGALGQPFVRFWMHNGMLNTREEKMSKSIGNIFTLREALKEYRPEVLVMYFISSHYRSPMEFSRTLLEEAVQQVERLKNLFRALDGYLLSAPSADEPACANETGVIHAFAERRHAFAEAMADDLNTGAALGELFALAREVNGALAERRVASDAAAMIRTGLGEMVHVLGLDAVLAAEGDVPADVVVLADQRQAARAAKDWATADLLRAAIKERGYDVRDAAGAHKLVPLE